MIREGQELIRLSDVRSFFDFSSHNKDLFRINEILASVDPVVQRKLLDEVRSQSDVIEVEITDINKKFRKANTTEDKLTTLTNKLALLIKKKSALEDYSISSDSPIAQSLIKKNDSRIEAVRIALNNLTQTQEKRAIIQNTETRKQFSAVIKAGNDITAAVNSNASLTEINNAVEIYNRLSKKAGLEEIPAMPKNGSQKEKESWKDFATRKINEAKDLFGIGGTSTTRGGGTGSTDKAATAIKNFSRPQ